MYKILEDTQTRLVIRLGDFLASTHCELDKATGLATIKRQYYGVIPAPVLKIPLAEIGELICVTDAHSHIVLVHRSGRRRWLPGDTLDNSFAAAERMSAFLGLAAPRSQWYFDVFADKGPRRYLGVALRWCWFLVMFGSGVVGIVTGLLYFAIYLFGEQNVWDFLHGRW